MVQASICSFLKFFQFPQTTWNSYAFILSLRIPDLTPTAAPWLPLHGHPPALACLCPKRFFLLSQWMWMRPQLVNSELLGHPVGCGHTFFCEVSLLCREGSFPSSLSFLRSGTWALTPLSRWKIPGLSQVYRIWTQNMNMRKCNHLVRRKTRREQ